MSPELRLLHRAADGDDDAYATWLTELRPRLVRYAADRLGGDRAEAEDVVQDSALRALVALRDGRIPANPQAWMYVIVRNRCHDVRDARRAADPLDDALGVSSRAAGPADALEARGELDAVVDAIGALPETQRRALVGTVFEGRPYEEIAAREATTVQAVKALVHRARRGIEAAGARAAAFVPAPVLRVRDMLGGLAGGADGGRDQLVGLVAQKTAAVASVAVVAAAAVPVAHHAHEHAAHPRQHRVEVVAKARPASARATPPRARPARHVDVRRAAARHVLVVAPKRSDDADAVVQACHDGQSLAGRFTARAMRVAGQQAASAEYGGEACAAAIAAAAATGA